MAKTLRIVVTDEEHARLKSQAALERKTIVELGRVALGLPAVPASGGTAADPRQLPIPGTEPDILQDMYGGPAPELPKTEGGPR